MAARLARAVSRQFLPSLFASALIGLAFPALARALNPFVYIGVFGFVLGALLGLDPPQVLKQLRFPGQSLTVVVWATVLLPLAANLLPPSLVPAHLLVPLVVVLAAPTGSTNAPVAAALGGNVVLSVLLAVLTLMLAPITMPLVIDQAASASAGDFQPVHGALRLVAILLASVAATAAVRLIGHDAGASGLADACASLGLLIFGIGAMAGMSELIIRDAGPAIQALIVSFCAYGLAFLAGALVFMSWGRATALSVGLASASRNMGFVWAAVGTSAPSTTYLFFACYMIPVHVMPLVFKGAQSAWISVCRKRAGSQGPPQDRELRTGPLRRLSRD